MKFNQLILVSLFLIQSTTANFFSPVEYNSTENWSIARHIYRFPPLVVESNGSLIHVLDSDDSEHAIHIYSVDYGLCKVPLKLNFHQRYPRRATTLGNGKIVIWLLNYRLTHQSTRVSLHEAKWRFAIVEPSSCSSAPSILAIKDSDLDYKPVDVVDVVGYYDHFEVFVNPLIHNNQKNIYGYRYYDNGVPIRKDTGNNLVIPDSDLYSHYHPNTARIHTVLRHNLSEGYFYLKIKSKPSHETLIKRFDSTFQPTFNTTLQKSSDSFERFDSYSIDHGNITYCRRTRRHLHCSLLDNSLRSKINLTLDYEQHIDYFSKIGRFSISNTPDGGAVLFVSIESNYRIGLPLYIQRIDVNGITEPVFIGRFFCEIHYLNSFEMPDGSYCVCAVCDELVHTRCFRLNSYDDDNDM